MKDTVEVTRGGRRESVHRVHVAVVDAQGALLRAAGDAGHPTFLRSAAKPFQALPLVEDGVAGALGLTTEELALCCASHSGQPTHLEGVRSILEKAGLDETALECGAHPPFRESEARRLMVEGREPRPIHNNCSGKHAGMLALARHHGWQTAGYRGADHPVQRRMSREVERWTELTSDRIGRGVDGCGVVCFAVPLDRMAGAFARFTEAARRGDPASSVVGAMTTHPFLVAGDDRLDTVVMRRLGSRVFTKTGAEGVHGAGLRERGWGVALKVEDGGRRAADAALVAVLEALDVVGPEDAEVVRLFGRPDVRNTRGEVVGAVVPRIELRPPERGS